MAAEEGAVEGLAGLASQRGERAVLDARGLPALQLHPVLDGQFAKRPPEVRMVLGDTCGELPDLGISRLFGSHMAGFDLRVAQPRCALQGARILDAQSLTRLRRQARRGVGPDPGLGSRRIRRGGSGCGKDRRRGVHPSQHHSALRWKSIGRPCGGPPQVTCR